MATLDNRTPTPSRLPIHTPKDPCCTKEIAQSKAGKSGERKRGRPSGRNRTPLSKAEQRARNDQYERERRQEHAAATAELAMQAGCDPNAPQTEVIATAVSFLRMGITQNEEIPELQRLNQKLIDHPASTNLLIAAAESWLAEIKVSLTSSDDSGSEEDETESREDDEFVPSPTVVEISLDPSEPDKVIPNVLEDELETPYLMSQDFGDLLTKDDINSIAEFNAQYDFFEHLT